VLAQDPVGRRPDRRRALPHRQNLATTYGSEPGPTAGRIGSFLMMSAYHVHGVTCAMFLTSMAANPLIAELTKKTINIEITWAAGRSASFPVDSFLAIPT